MLGISSDGDNRRIFLGLTFFESGIFSGTQIWQVFFGYLDLSRDFWGVLKRISSVLAARIE